LLVLRIVVGVTAAVQGGMSLSSAPEPAVVTVCAALLGIVSGGSLLIGFATPGAAALAGLTLAFLAISSFPGPTVLLLDRVGALCVAAVAVAVALLGPGALSLDARLFGRRELIFPHDQSRS
jgi:uncharacterized membrane protein YphA (DoxX/SURF4 family)